jgi:hypothetical protein
MGPSCAYGMQGTMQTPRTRLARPAFAAFGRSAARARRVLVLTCSAAFGQLENTATARCDQRARALQTTFVNIVSCDQQALFGFNEGTF